MQYGFCLDTGFLTGDAESHIIFNAVGEAGFDYAELRLNSLWGITAKETAALKEALGIIPCKACNYFFPASITLVGPQRDMAGIDAYLEKMLPLALDLGVENLIFGNGGARKIPENESRQTIWAHLREIVECMDKHARNAGIIISVEPLNSRESNIINSYGEAVELTAGLTHVSAMIDSYHVAMDGQNYEDVYKNPEALWHLHTAYPAGRMAPSPTDDMSIYADFVQMVKKLGYNGKISVEGSLRATEPLAIKAEVKACLETLRQLFG